MRCYKVVPKEFWCRIWGRYGWGIMFSPILLGLVACPSPTTTKAFQKPDRSLHQQLTFVPKGKSASLLLEDPFLASFRHSPTDTNPIPNPDQLSASTHVAVKKALPPTLKSPPPRPSTPPTLNTLNQHPPQKNVRVASIQMMPSASKHLEPPAPLPTPQPALPKELPGIQEIANQFQALGNDSVKSARYLLWRQRRLIKKCRRASYSNPACRIFKRSALMFSYNYRTSPRNYRGYLLFHSRRKKNIPKYLMRWYQQISAKRYKNNPPTGRCYLSEGLVSNCMSYVMCSQKRALRRFRENGKGSRGYHFPLWGYINYWTTESYDTMFEDTKRRGKVIPGIRSFLREIDTLDLKTKQERARALLNRMFTDYTRRIRRSRKVKRHYTPIFEKAFCTNLVSSAGDYSRVLPGDLFVLTTKHRRGKHGRTYHKFHHWGMVVNPKNGKIIHNQTPGGVWGSSYNRWGFQYDTWDAEYVKPQKWKRYRRSRHYSQRVVFFNRLNLHFFQFARKQKARIYDFAQPNLCRQWINKYALLYFTNLAKYVDTSR